MASHGHIVPAGRSALALIQHRHRPVIATIAIWLWHGSHAADLDGYGLITGPKPLIGTLRTIFLRNCLWPPRHGGKMTKFLIYAGEGHVLDR